MTKEYEIILKYIKDISVEIANAETFIFSRENITKYSLGINITTKPLKDEMIDFLRPCPTISIDIFEIHKYLGKKFNKSMKKNSLITSKCLKK